MDGHDCASCELHNLWRVVVPRYHSRKFQWYRKMSYFVRPRHRILSACLLQEATCHDFSCHALPHNFANTQVKIMFFSANRMFHLAIPMHAATQNKAQATDVSWHKWSMLGAMRGVLHQCRAPHRHFPLALYRWQEGPAKGTATPCLHFGTPRQQEVDCSQTK